MTSPLARKAAIPTEEERSVLYSALILGRCERLHTEEPPLSADERHRMAWEERQALRSGRVL